MNPSQPQNNPPANVASGNGERKLGSLLASQRELPKPPFPMIAAFIVLTVATWVPLAIIARARVTRSEEPRIHLVQDMGNQPKLKAEDASDVFADGQAMRLPIPGTVARGELEDDDHYYRGFTPVANAAPGQPDVTFFDTFPDQVQLTPALLHRGQQRFNIYCSVCHGLDGYGNGQINARAVEKQEPRWVPAANLHSETVRARPVGHIFNTISNGIRNMGGYGAQIPVEDRWAIVAYVRALQTSQAAPASAVPTEKLNTIR